MLLWFFLIVLEFFMAFPRFTECVPSFSKVFVVFLFGFFALFL